MGRVTYLSTSAQSEVGSEAEDQRPAMLCQQSQSEATDSRGLDPQQSASWGLLRGAMMEPPNLNQQEALGILRQKGERRG